MPLFNCLYRRHAMQAFADGLKYHDAIWSQSIEMVMRRLPTRENTAV